MNEQTQYATPNEQELVLTACRLKREKGVSWTKLPNALFEETGVLMPTHKIRDMVRRQNDTKRRLVSARATGKFIIEVAHNVIVREFFSNTANRLANCFS